MPVADRGGDVWLRWLDGGDPDGDPVLLIMGLGGSARPWWRLTPHLDPALRVVRFDNRGTGESSRVATPFGGLTMADLVADTLAVMDDAGLADAHVVGVSMGGMIAQHLALDHRDRVRSLLLGCTTAVGREGTPPWRMLAATALRPALGPERTFSLVAPSLYVPRTLREHPERVREDLRVRAADATPPVTIVAQMGAVSRHDTRPRLAELDGLPVTVVHGEQDALIGPERGRELAAGIPGARFVGIPECGHLMTTDAEAATAAAVNEHLARAGAAAPAATA